MMLSSLRICALFLILTFVLAACANAENATPKPSATPFPTFEFVAPTNPPVFNSTTEEAETVAATPDAQSIERGRGRYEALDCASCHGDNGEGTDKAGTLIGMSLSQEDFTSFMLSGGDMGAEHQYSTDRLSARGGQNLYQYLVSLAENGD